MRDSPDPGERAGTHVAETMLLIGAIGLMAWPAIKGIARAWRVRHPLAESEAAVDKKLDETFPASDPPASAYVDIPVNRR
jgi:hypothetical protein